MRRRNTQLVRNDIVSAAPTATSRVQCCTHERVPLLAGSGLV